MNKCSVSSIHPNNLILPTCDLHSKQARGQILYNFHNFAHATSTISERQWQKCKEQNERIKVLGQRIMKCKTQITHMEGLNKAICLVSPSQYPKKYEFNVDNHQSHLQDFFIHNNPTKFDHNTQYRLKHDSKEIGSESGLKIKDLQECATFIFDKLRMQSKDILHKRLENNETTVNYGKIPQNVQYLDSLSVFNSKINPYKKYSIQSNMFKLDNKSKICHQQLQKEKISSMTKFKLSQYKRVENIAEDKKYSAQKLWQDIKFDQNLELANLVDIITEKQDGNEFIKTKNPKINIKASNIQQNSQLSSSQQLKEQKNNIIMKSEQMKLILNDNKSNYEAIKKNMTSVSQEIKSQKLQTIQIKPQILTKQAPLIFSPNNSLPTPTLALTASVSQLPRLNLPLPPPLTIPLITNIPQLPKLNLPPPPLLSLPLPPLLTDMPIAPPSSSTIDNSRKPDIDLFTQIQNAKAKLKSVTTNRTGPKESFPRDDYQHSEKERDKQPNDEDSYNVMKILRKRRERRYQALHPNEQS